MNNRLPMLHGSDAEDTFHRAMQRQAKDSTIPKGKRTLGTHYSELESPAEPTSTPSWADEIDDEREGDSWVGTVLIIFILTTAAMGLAAFIFG